jgi:histidinol-phosphatase (PHP family)
MDKYIQKFNYHTHTYRSGHSEYVSDEEMLLAAKREGIVALGFTEHIPNPDLVLPEENNKMLFSETDEYISSINSLKESHPEMRILVGFEAEYDPIKDAYLGEMREKADYMILGQHFVTNGLDMIKPTDPDYPLIYANMVCKGIESGIFDIVAHPDYFMRYRESMKTPKEREMFFKNAVVASQRICRRAKEMGIPLEINLNGADRLLPNGNIEYPHFIFWDEAAKVDGLTVIIGIDAHRTSSFKKINDIPDEIDDIIDIVKDKIVYGGYDPVLARQNNQKLKDAYIKNQEQADSFETNMIHFVLDRTEKSIEEDIDPEKSVIAVDQALNASLEKCNRSAEIKKESLKDEIVDISNNLDMPSKERIGKLERKRKTISEVNMILANQERMLNRLRRLGLKRAHKGIVIGRQKKFPDILKLNLNNENDKYSGYASTILISIITIIAGFLIIVILYSLYK